MATTPEQTQQKQQAPEDEIQERIQLLQSELKDYIVKQKDVMRNMLQTLSGLQKSVAKAARMSNKSRRRKSPVHRFKLNSKSVKTLSSLGLSGDTFSRSEVMKAVSAYVKSKSLQNPNKKTVWSPDKTLQKMFSLKKGDEYSYLQINKFIAPFFKDAEKVEASVEEATS